MSLAHGAAGAATLALLELDAASIGSLLLSRPFVIGPLIGAILGNPLLGAGLGITVEAVTLEELPLGGNLGLSAPVAAGVSVWLAAGPWRVPVEAAFLTGLAVGWLQTRVEYFLRDRRSSHVHRALERLERKHGPELGYELATALGVQAFATFILAAVTFLFFGPALSSLWPILPLELKQGARFAFQVAPWIGAGGLIASLWRKR